MPLLWSDIFLYAAPKSLVSPTMFSGQPAGAIAGEFLIKNSQNRYGIWLADIDNLQQKWYSYFGT